jgi:hypothetical protein
MSALIRAFGLMVSIIFCSSLVANQADAQLFRAAARVAGVFPGDGYHVCQPLIDSSYYHPYSAANSALLTTPSAGGRVMGLTGSQAFGTYGTDFGSFPGHTARTAAQPIRFAPSISR